MAIRLVFCSLLLAIPAPLASAPPAAAPMPRTPDGKPDFTGVWDTRLVNDMSHGDEGSIPYTAAGRAAWKKTNLKNDPLFACLFPGVPRIMLSGLPIQIVQKPGLIVILFELMRLWRTVYLDGRAHPAKMELAFLGDSTGSWDGDTLVIDTVKLKGSPWTWLDPVGHQNSDSMHVIERLKRTHEGIEYQATIDDPPMYSKPWPVRAILFKPMKTNPNLGDLIEFSCNENNKDLSHMVSTKTVDPGWDLNHPLHIVKVHLPLFAGIGLAELAMLLGAIAWFRARLRARAGK